MTLERLLNRAASFLCLPFLKYVPVFAFVWHNVQHVGQYQTHQRATAYVFVELGQPFKLVNGNVLVVLK